MSCGDHHDTDCSEVLAAVYQFLDGEITDSRKHVIREHLDECAPCLRQFGIEQEVKALVARCCGSDRAPEALRIKIITRIQQVRVELGQVEYRAD
ncbi:MAG TPA: mycothiol system anti-sigma-R factor [Actinomycetes bacterium]|jgi:mycothiol system anti-sigma-R factor